MEEMKHYMVIADSSTWLDYFEKDKTKHALILETLIKEDKIVICGYTLAEILKDIKDKETFEKLLKGFLALPYVEIEKEDWIKASKIVFEFKGLSIEEGLLCALSQRKNLKVLTKNKEIKKIKGVKLYENEKE
jgi:predicted nucleic acid-binding protein